MSNKETKKVSYEQRLEQVAQLFNELKDEQIIRNPSKIQQGTALQIIICPKTSKFIANPMKR